MKNFRTLLLAAAAVISIGGAAKAEDRLICAIHDRDGSSVTYAFGPDTADGALFGTMVENSFVKNGTTTTSKVGNRPIWNFNATDGDNYILRSRANPGWRIAVGNQYAKLFHNGSEAGRGFCGSAADVQDDLALERGMM